MSLTARVIVGHPDEEQWVGEHPDTLAIDEQMIHGTKYLRIRVANEPDGPIWLKWPHDYVRHLDVFWTAEPC